MVKRKRNVRIGNVSGATGDHPQAMARMVDNGDIDVITGDWLSEMNIAWNAIIKQENPELGYEAGFLLQLQDCLDGIANKGIKVITNAGASNTEALVREVRNLCQSRGHGNLVVAAVVGDDVSHLLTSSAKDEISQLHHLDHCQQTLQKWELNPICGNAYIGSWGIHKALVCGADIVICGRVTDASPVIGASAWWHDWKANFYDELAGALVAGRMCKASPQYRIGADFSNRSD